MSPLNWNATHTFSSLTHPKIFGAFCEFDKLQTWASYIRLWVTQEKRHKEKGKENLLQSPSTHQKCWSWLKRFSLLMGDLITHLDSSANPCRRELSYHHIKVRMVNRSLQIQLKIRKSFESIVCYHISQTSHVWIPFTPCSGPPWWQKHFAENVKLSNL